MTTKDLKQTIEQRAGVPASLLTGSSEKEILAQARALVSFKEQIKTAGPADPAKLSPAERFAEWFSAVQGEDQEEPQSAAVVLDEIAESLRMETGGYPAFRDGGEPAHIPDGRSKADKFSEWFGAVSAFDPRNSVDL